MGRLHFYTPFYRKVVFFIRMNFNFPNTISDDLLYSLNVYFYFSQTGSLTIPKAATGDFWLKANTICSDLTYSIL